MTDIVLVHGAFQGGWVWDALAGHLRPEGFRVHAPTLSGCGYLRRGLRPETGPAEWIEELLAFLRLHTQGRVILAGNSFAGLLCAGVLMRAPERIRQTVFIDAMLPEPGKSFLDQAGAPFAALLEKHTNGDGLVSPWPPPVFGIPEEQWPDFASRLATFPASAFRAPFSGDFDPQRAPCAYIACNRTASPFIRAMAARARDLGWQMRELDSGHCPMVTHPQELAGLLTGLAQAQMC